MELVLSKSFALLVYLSSIKRALVDRMLCFESALLVISILVSSCLLTYSLIPWPCSVAPAHFYLSLRDDSVLGCSWLDLLFLVSVLADLPLCHYNTPSFLLSTFINTTGASFTDSLPFLDETIFFILKYYQSSMCSREATLDQENKPSII